METSRFSQNFRVGAASVIGPHHLKMELPNQDSYAYFQSEGLIVIAVADGLGSASHADEGSRFATHNAVYQLLRYLCSYDSPRSRLPDIAALNRQIVAVWQRRFAQAMSDYDTTLLFVGLSPKVCVMGQIGDGLILYQGSSTSDTFNVFYKSEKEYLNKPESSMAQLNALECLYVQERALKSDEYYTAFFIMTDGIADDLTDPTLYSSELVKELSTSFSGHWNNVLDQHLVEWPTPGHYDDKTLVAVIGEFRERQGQTIEREKSSHDQVSQVIPGTS